MENSSTETTTIFYNSFLENTRNCYTLYLFLIL